MNETKFAKLYETDLGQILVKIDDGDEGVEVRFFFMPEDLGVCSFAVQFSEGSEEMCWHKAEALFNSITEEIAIKHVSGVIESLEF